MKRYSAFLALLFTVAFGVHVLAQPAGFGGQPIGFPHASSGGGGGAPTDATYITQTPNGSLSAEQALSALSTGILKNTTTTGVLSIAVEGTDYYKPGGTDVAIADGGTGASTKAGAFDALSPMTTAGDLIYFSTTGTRLALGTSGTFLKAGASAPSWANIVASDITSGTFAIARGGTNSTATPTAGGIACGDGSAYQFTTAGTTGNSLKSNGSSAPTWAALNLSGGSNYVSGALPIANGGTNNASLSVTNNSVLYADGSKVVSLAPGSEEQFVGWDTSGNVAATMPPFTPSVLTPNGGWVRGQLAPGTATATSLTGVGPISSTAAGVGSSGTDSDGICVNFATNALANNDGGIYNGTFTRFDSKPVYWARIKYPASGDMLVQRSWFGLTSNSALNGTDTPACHLAAFRFSTSASDTVFQAVTADGTTQTVASTGITPTAGTVYTLCIDCRDLANIKFYINGSLTNTLTTHLPTGSLAAGGYADVRTLENVTKNLKVYSLLAIQK